jgi:uncharacterized delta-60 repeat protein
MIPTSRLAAITLAFSSLPLALHATDSTLDGAFVSTISPGLTPDGYIPPPASPNWLSGTGAVNAVALQSDGKIIAGGNISRYQAPPAGSPRSSLKRLNPDGTLDTVFGAIASTLADTQGDTEVNKILTVAGDKLYVGGVFTHYQGSVRSGLMRLNADGSLDTSFNTIGISNSSTFGMRYVLALAEQPDGKLLVGGGYNRANGVFRPGLARFNSDGSLDTAFNPFPALPTDSSAQDIAVLPNGQILVAGGKPRPGGGGTPLLVRLNSDGSLDASLAPSFADEFGDIDEMIALPDGRIVIGGDFSFLPTGTSYNLACLLPDGSLDTAFMANLGSGPNGWAGGEVTLQPDGTIFVGGIFTTWNNQPRASIARLLPDGTLDAAFAPPPYVATTALGYSTHFYSFAFQPDGKLVAGGWFARVIDTAVESYNLTRFVNEYSPASPGTLRLVATTVSVGENQPSATLQVSRYAGTTGAVTVDFTTLTGGADGNATASLDFTSASGTLTWAAGESGLKSITVPLLADATLDGAKTFTVQLSNPTGSPFLPTPTSRATVTILDADALPAITTQPASVSLEQGARFSLSVRYDSVLAATVQWQRDPDGDGPLPYADIPGATSTVYTVATADAATHAGTYRAVITNPNGTTPGNGATVSISVPAGSLVTTFTPAASTPIATTAAQDSSGRFLIAHNSGLRRLGADGTLEPTTSFGITVSTISAILPLADGRTLIGGNFGTLTHQPSSATSTVSSRLVRLNADATGTIDTSYSASISGPVQTLAPGASGKFYVGSTVTLTASGGNIGLQRFLANGSTDTTFTPPFFSGSGTYSVKFIHELSPTQIIAVYSFSGSTGDKIVRFNVAATTPYAVTLDTTFGTAGIFSIAVNNPINGLSVLPDGRIAFSTFFSNLIAPDQQYVGLLNTNGTPDTTFKFNNVLAGGRPKGLAYRDGRLLVWGDFTTVNGANQTTLARVNLDGSVDSTFSVGVGAANPFDRSINRALYTSTGEIFIAGKFNDFKGVARNNAALLVGNPQISAIGFAPPRLSVVEGNQSLSLTLRRYGPATEAATIAYTTVDATATAGSDYTATAGNVSWAAGDSADKTVSITLLDDTVIESSEIFSVALSSPTGPVGPAGQATLTLIDSDTPVTFTAQPLGSALIENGSLTLSATATSPSPVTYQWFINGVAIPGATSGTYVKTPVTTTDGGLYTLVATNAAGAFTATPSLVVIRPQPGRPVASQTSTGRPVFGTSPVGLVVANDGSVYIGGAFAASLPNNVPQANFIRVKPDGATDTAFTYTPGAAITALARQLDGKILLAGSFTNRVVRLNADGTVDTDFATTLGSSLNSAGQVNDFAFDSTGRIYVGGANYVFRLSTAGAYDSTYTPVVNGSVTALAVQNTDDKLLVGGSFNTLAGSSAGRLGRLNTDGTRDTAFVSGIGGSGIYNELLVLADGRILVAGSNFANSATYALVNPDGSFGSNIASSSQVYRLAQAPGGKVVSIQANAASSILRLLGTNPLPSPGSNDFDTTFNIGTGPNAEARALAIGPDGGIWITGLFTTVNGVATGGIAKLNSDPLNPAIVNHPVRTDANLGATARLSVGASGTGLTYEWFKNGSPLANDARISGASTAILTITGLLATDDDTYTVSVTGGTPATTLTSTPAKLNVLAAPVVVTSLPSATPALGSTITLAPEFLAATPATYVWTRNGVPIINGGRYSGASTGTLVITGANASDNGAYTLTVTNTLGTAATTPATVTVAQVATDRDAATTALGITGTNFNHAVNDILHLPDGRILLALNGSLNGANSTNTFANLVIVNADRTVAATPAGDFSGGSVLRLFRQPDGKILAVGFFTQVGSTTRNRIARLNADLTLDTTFAPVGLTGGSSVSIAQVFSDSLGRVYLSGNFATYGGVSDYNFVVRLDATTGALDLSFKPQLNGFATHVAKLPDGSLLLAGSFTRRGPLDAQITIPSLLRLSADGVFDFAYAPAITVPGAFSTNIEALATDATGRTYLAQRLNTPTGQIHDVRRLLENGTVDPTFTCDTSIFNGSITAFAPLPSGKLLCAGAFTTPANRLLRLNSNGTVDNTYDLGTGFNSGGVSVLAPDALGRLWVGGTGFTTFQGTAAGRLLVLQGEGAPALAFATQPGSQVRDLGTTATFTAAATGNNGFTYQWLRNGLPLADGGRISGATTGTLTVTGLQVSDATSYSVVVTSPGATLTSAAAQLTVLTTPEILATPASLTVELGGTATFTGSARGAGTLSYQWLFNGTPLANGTSGGVTIAGATTPSLTVAGVNFDTDGSYRLRVTNTLGQTTTAAAVLTVERRPGSLAAGITQASPNGTVLAILRLADGSMLVGGQFDSVTINGVVNNRSRLARFLANGTLDPAFTPTFNGDVRALAQDSSGSIFVGGNFNGSTTVGGVTANRIRVARLTSALVLDTAFDTSTAGPNNSINAVAPTDDGGVYVGGAFNFNRVGTAVVNRVARLSATGALDTAFATLAFPVNNEVKALLRRPDGKLYVGGTFGNTLLTDTGAQDTAFGGVTSGQAFLLRADGNLMVAGGNPYFSIVNGNTGVALKSYVTGHFLAVSSLAQQSDGKLLSGSYGPLKRTNPATDLDDTGFVGGDNYIYALAVDGAGRIWAGGAFSTFAGVARPRLAILNGGEFESQSGPLTPQVITFPTLADKNTLDAPFALTATSDSGLPVSYAISGPATLSGSTVTLTGGTGTVTITATQTGNTSTAAATPVIRSFSVTAADPLADFLATANVPTNLRGPNDDPDGDNLDNLLEYALDLNPNGSGGAFTGTPPTSVQTPTQLTYTYRRVRNDVTYIVETSPTLIGGTWTSVGVTQGTPGPDGTTSASIPITPGSGFLRLSVTR